jgi:hypothetical protein
MSLVDPAFESNVITLLKGIYDNIGSGLPYTSICGKFNQENDGDVYPINYKILSNTTGYDIDIQSVGVGALEIYIDTRVGSSNAVLFVGPLVDYRTVVSKQLRNEEPLTYRLLSTNVSDLSQDPRGFGSGNGWFVEFELRFYPEV